ncbi:MAG: tryptophan-rich sensory protein [Alphaproteobacteria bacterium]|nr:tryptophan-rich sensory protein [Alphaproteobacteria bacterium]
MKKFIPPLLWIIGFQAISGLIGFATAANMGWYRTLEKAPLNPPDLAFPIVWTTLYVLLALAGWLVWTKRNDDGFALAFRLYWVQMLLNWGWSFVFFAAHLVVIGFFWIVALDLAMIAFIIVAWNKSRIAALLVLPTVIWGSFAAYLNVMIWILN